MPPYRVPTTCVRTATAPLVDLTQRITVVGLHIGHVTLSLLRHSDRAMMSSPPPATPVVTPGGPHASPPDLVLSPSQSPPEDNGVLRVPVANVGMVTVSVTPAPRKKYV